MRAPSLLLRCCSIIPLIHLVILSCLILGICTGQVFYQLTPDGVFIDVVVFALFQLGPLVFPPLAAWGAFRFPTRLLSLVGLWISPALTFMACLYYSWTLPVPPFFSSMLPGLSLGGSSGGHRDRERRTLWPCGRRETARFGEPPGLAPDDRRCPGSPLPPGDRTEPLFSVRGRLFSLCVF